MTRQIKIGYQKMFDHDIYTVISVKNTIEHLPGEELPRQEVDRLCKSSIWDVTLVKLNVEKST